MNDQSPIDPKVSIAAHTADARTVEEGLAIQERQAVLDSESATAVAMQDTLLTPRFYTTDFDELDAIDVTPVRDDWDALIAEMEADPNRGHFRKTADWDHVDWAGMDPELKKEFIDFLISSCTAEFSGCVLYKEMKRRGNNRDITQLFQLMARDEAPAEVHLLCHLSVGKDRLCAVYHDLPPPGGQPGPPLSPDLQMVRGVVQ